MPWRTCSRSPMTPGSTWRAPILTRWAPIGAAPGHTTKGLPTNLAGELVHGTGSPPERPIIKLADPSTKEQVPNNA
jgi:hypothetical protein